MVRPPFPLSRTASRVRGEIGYVLSWSKSPWNKRHRHYEPVNCTPTNGGTGPRAPGGRTPGVNLGYQEHV